MATLRQLREQRCLTQEQLAVAAEVSTSTVYHIEAGKVRPRPAIVRRLARILEVAPSDIDVLSRPRDDGKASVVVYAAVMERDLVPVPGVETMASIDMAAP